MIPRGLPVGSYKVLCVPSPEQAVGLPEAGVGAGGGPAGLEHAPQCCPVLLRVIHQARPRLRGAGGSGGGGAAGLAALVTHNNFARKR